jgi:hypothetical protein
VSYESTLVRNLERRSRRFSSAVLTWLDEEGFPFSMRCRPAFDSTRITIELPSPMGAPAGPAGLLYHSHNDRLWRLRMLLVVGLLERDGDTWLFRPARIVTGVAGVNKLHMTRSFFNARRATKRYLQEREMTRPKIPWKRIRELQRELND